MRRLSLLLGPAVAIIGSIGLVMFGSALVGVVLLLLSASVWLNGSALETMITDTSGLHKPAEWAAHLAGILNNSLFVFAGLGVLGLLQALAALFLPLATPDAGSKV